MTAKSFHFVAYIISLGLQLGMPSALLQLRSEVKTDEYLFRGACRLLGGLNIFFFFSF